MIRTVRPSIRNRGGSRSADLRLFATTAPGLEGVLLSELRRLGATDPKEALRGVSFGGDLGMLYRANLWSRTATRVLVRIAEFDTRDRDHLYKGSREVAWEEHMTPDMTLAVDAVGGNSEIHHTQFASQVVKDGIVDRFRDKVGRRPAVDVKKPDIRINARINGDRCILSWDSSGQRLHRRGYRSSFGGPTPLQETLAAGILLLSGYDGSGELIDPMCGSGTILVEAAMMAKNLAPGILGREFAFMRHLSFNRRLWSNELEDAQRAVREVDGCRVRGSDVSEDSVRAARTAVLGAGVDDIVAVRRMDMRSLSVSESAGHVVTNPPYGERLGEINRLADLYADLGDTLKQRCSGMTAHVLTSSKFLAGKIGLKTRKRDILWNGPLECRLLHFDLF
jgi:putative N6-adenine-specific DNA methylase